MQAVDTTFSKILQIEGNQEHYHVPKYQREYSWGKLQWEKLIQDIYENEPGHYMGSIICVSDLEYVPGNEHIFEVIDGQQRLTTLSLLLMAIYTKYSLLAEDIDLDDLDEQAAYQNQKFSIQKKLIKKIKPESGKLNQIDGFRENGKMCFLRVQPSSQNHNLDDYKFILHEIGILKDHQRQKYCRLRAIYKCYKYFLSQIPDNREALDELIDKINRLVFIHISVTSQANAFTLFETLNNRGLPLSAIDIIKNKMLSEMEKQKNINVDESYDKWQMLLNYLPDYQNQERFLRQFYNAFKVDPRIRIERFPRATSSSLIAIYENLIKKEAKFIFDELLEKTEYYNRLIEPEDQDENVLTKELIDLKRVNAAPANLLLLYLIAQESQNIFEGKNFLVKVTQLLNKYYVRRNITDFPNTRDLDAINIDLVERCHYQLKSGNKLSYDFIEHHLLTGKGKPADINLFRNNLTDNLFLNNAGMARYILAKIDSISHNREYKPDLWTRNEKGLLVWTVEHVFPQGENIPKEWIDMIANGDRAEAEKIQEECVHCLGNLTLSGYNSKLSNAAFTKKQSLYENRKFLGHKINIGYKNGLALNNLEFEVNGQRISLATIPIWTKDMIMARNKRMVELIIDLYRFNNE